VSGFEAERTFALHLADLADAISLPAFRAGLTHRMKADGSLVTESDEHVERVLRAEITGAFPADAVLGEEHGATDDRPRRWVIDPIDATSNYAWGIPVWATLIALESEGEPVLGVVSAPALGERYDAVRGGGSRRNGDPIHVTDVADIAQARVGFTTTVFGMMGERFLALTRQIRETRGLGDFWGHMMVAAGAIDAMLEPIAAVWDLAALLPIVEEAGGRFTDLDGNRRADGGNALSSNGKLHDELLARL
jgi:histidinol-phosphatase